MKQLRIGLVCALALGFSACDNSSGSDAGGTDAGGEVPVLPLLSAYQEVAEEFVDAPLEMACLGVGTRPTPGSPIDVRFELRDFQDDFIVPGIDVWLFNNNEIADTCAAPNCEILTTDSSGDAMTMLPADGWYAYRVIPKEGVSRGTTVFGVFQYNEPAPPTAGQAVVGNSVSGSTIDLIPALLGISREPGLAIVAGRLYDCSEHFLSGAVIRIFDPDGVEVLSGPDNADPHISYFDGNAANNLPNQGQRFSNTDGLYVVPQVPVIDERPYRVEMWAHIDDTPAGTFTRIGCESARIFPDAVTILNLGPMRADAPAVCAP